ncbi:MAG TPA: RNA methyltransferase [Candidatus Jeotgalibaca pullicola]|nr:RNA methyltransferase [Candidatus Jeotgalibaca pullicola]
MEKIISTSNQKVKEWRKLHTLKGRKQSAMYMIEGEHLFIEAIKNNITIETIIITENYLRKYSEAEQEELFTKAILVSDSVMRSLSQTETAPGVICILSIIEQKLPKEITGKYILLDAVQDPGNAGTIVRTADAAGFNGVVFGTGSVDPFNDKVIRSMQGSHFHIPIYRMSLPELIDRLQESAIPVFGTALDEKAQRYRDVPITDSAAIILGNEGNGVSNQLLAKTDGNIYIPIIGKAESLNVAVAASILMYHFVP